MPPTDRYLIIAIEAVVTMLTLVAVVKDLLIRAREEVGVVVTRGEGSLKALYTGYAASLASFLVLVNNAEGIEGQKVYVYGDLG